MGPLQIDNRTANLGSHRYGRSTWTPDAAEILFVMFNIAGLREPYWDWLQAMQTFVLWHANDLLLSSDADLLLRLASPGRRS